MGPAERSNPPRRNATRQAFCFRRRWPTHGLQRRAMAGNQQSNEHAVGVSGEADRPRADPRHKIKGSGTRHRRDFHYGRAGGGTGFFPAHVRCRFTDPDSRPGKRGQYDNRNHIGHFQFVVRTDPRTCLIDGGYNGAFGVVLRAPPAQRDALQ
jgi:hypothetical protein